MKTSKILASAMMAAIAFASCTESEKAVANEELKTDSIKYEQKTKDTEVSLKVDFPTSGNPTLTNIIAEYISEQLGGTYAGTLTQGDSILNYYGQAQRDSLMAERQDMGATPMPYLYSCDIKKDAETDKYVTYTCYTEIYLGGAHGSHMVEGTTFRKADGRRFGYDMLRNTDSDAFHKLIKEGLIRYFNTGTTLAVKTDGELKNCLLVEDDVNYLPLPRTAPYLSKDGMTFIYQSYEIASYAAGMPTFTIPFDQVKPFLTETAKKMLGQ